MSKHPVIHFLHDVGLATWAGGSLNGAIGLNGAAAALDDPSQRMHASTAGWSRWLPVNAAGLAAHLVGATGILVTDWPRVRHQEGVARSSAIKGAATGVALGVAAWSAVLNRTMAQHSPAPVAGATEASAQTPPAVAKAQQQLKVVQWLNPLVSFGLIGLTAWHEEQQRTAQVAEGVLKRRVGGVPVPYVAAAAAGLGLLAARRGGSKDSSRDSSSTAGTATTAPAYPSSRPPVASTRPAPVVAAPVVAAPVEPAPVEVVALETDAIELDGATARDSSTTL